MTNGFYLFANYAEDFNMLTKSQWGELLLAIFAYERGEDVPPFKSKHLQRAFNVITSDMEN
ncbi:MAG: DUF6291 domain-containing protein, partial [Firmicutes bacterium]|nr:DUF6291 domain-containing protein [Bacillota bacterium]